MTRLSEGEACNVAQASLPLKKIFILFCWKYLDRRCIVCYDIPMNSRPP